MCDSVTRANIPEAEVYLILDQHDNTIKVITDPDSVPALLNRYNSSLVVCGDMETWFDVPSGPGAEAPVPHPRVFLG